MAAATITIPMRGVAASTGSFRSTSMSQVVRRPPRRWSTVFCSCRRKSAAPAPLPAEDVRMTDSKPSDGKAILREQAQALRDLGDHVAASLPNDTLDWPVAHGELTVHALTDRMAKNITEERRAG